MSISEDEIDKQVAQHRFGKNEEYFDEYRSNDLCAGAVCPEYVDKLSECCECIGDYSINILFEVQPALTWENLKETVLIAQVLSVPPQP
jgi:hypothetical protein